MAENKLTIDETTELRYFWGLGAKPLDLAKAYNISPEAAYAHTTYRHKREQYRKKYYSQEMPHVKEQRKQWEQSEKGKRCKFNTHIKSWYSITIEQYEEKLKEQKFACAICQRDQSLFKNRLHVDHNHLTGKVRGLLCMDCNTRLETLENKEFCMKASLYFQRYSL